jgi:hypothetical protein
MIFGRRARGRGKENPSYRRARGGLPDGWCTGRATGADAVRKIRRVGGLTYLKSHVRSRGERAAVRLAFPIKSPGGVRGATCVRHVRIGTCGAVWGDGLTWLIGAGVYQQSDAVL